MIEPQNLGAEINHLNDISAQEAVVTEAEKIAADEHDRLVESAGYLGELAVPAPDLSKIDESMATMITINHGNQSED